MRRKIELIIFFAALLLAAMAFHAWLAAHDEQQRLQATLAAQKQLLDAADARERDRNAALNQTLASIAKLKSDTRTPEEILRELPQYLPLPQPITLGTSAAQPATNARAAGSPPLATAPGQQGTAVSESASGAAPSDCESGLQTCLLKAGSSPAANLAASPPSSASFSSSASQALPPASTATIPAADLQPLFDFVQDCRACQARLAVAQQNASDDDAKIAALARERDAAITASKGGTFWRRLRRNALWFAIGAGAGIALAKH